jgi:acyl-coenzyme A synthetase/AMP-(fatty) acid ligase
MMPSIPLLAHDDLDAVFAWREGRAVPVREFLADVERVAAAMPPSRHVLNACSDRYHVAVGFAAAVLSGKVNLLPSTRTADTVRHLRASAPDLFCLVDGECELELPRMSYPPAAGVDTATPARMPWVPADQQVACVFTSGSTGAPIPHDKTWGSLVHCIRCGQRRLALPAGTTLVGTVPAQHMYGFESTLLMAFHGDVALSAGHPFYPADVAAELARVPAPRLLVSTPVHLRALLAADVALPPLQMVLCATAPLSAELAHAVESRLGAPLVEIYGSTETGQIATRRTARTDSFSLLDGLELVPVGEGVAMASGGHLLAPTPIHDVIEKVSDGDFLLHGRSADMVNVAGKRSSIAHLNHQLCAVPGVLDGAFFAPDAAASDTVPRLMAFAVAPGLSPATLRQALRERIDPAFMPRPLVLVDALPRNTTGKLPRAALATLAAEYVDTVERHDD